MKKKCNEHGKKKEEKLKGDSKENNQSNLTKHVRNTKKYFLTEGTFLFYFHLSSHELGIYFTALCFVFLFFHLPSVTEIKVSDNTAVVLPSDQIKSNFNQTKLMQSPAGH